MPDATKIETIGELLKDAKWLEGKTLAEISDSIKNEDFVPRVSSKAYVGYVIEKGYFQIERNNNSQPDFPQLGVELKTCPLKYNKARTKLTVKEPLSLNIINYNLESQNNDLTESSLFKKNRNILFVFYIHDFEKKRSEYIIKYSFLWNMDKEVISDLNPDYLKIIKMIKAGKAHEIHQDQHEYLTICPKHGGKFKDPSCKKSKTTQPFSKVPAEVRAFRLKNSYVDLIISRELKKNDYWPR